MHSCYFPLPSLFYDSSDFDLKDTHTHHFDINSQTTGVFDEIIKVSFHTGLWECDMGGPMAVKQGE